VSTYSFISVQARITGPGGSIEIGNSAGAAKEGITSEYDEDKDKADTGADGQVMHSLHAGQTGTLTFRLLKTSPVNAQLSQMINFQRTFPALWGQNVIRVSDTARGDVVLGREMAFVRNPRVTWAEDADMIEWQFRGVVNESLGPGLPTLSNP
jgi:hypothetical protein